MTVLIHLTQAQNLPSIERHGFIAEVGPRARKTGQEQAGIFLWRTLEAAETGLLEWFGSWFDRGDGPLALLAVDIEEAVQDDPAEFELFYPDDIPADRITVLAGDVNDVTHFGDLQRQLAAICDCLTSTYDNQGSPTP
jgi:hypothetical protein